MDILIWILFSLLLVLISSLVFIILKPVKCDSSEYMGNHPAGERIFDETLKNNKDLLEKCYEKKIITEK